MKMQLFKRTLKLFGCMAAALVGVAAAVLIFMSFMVVEVEDSFMLPELEPGSSVIAVRTPLPVDIGLKPSVKVGDLVVYRALYYGIDAGGVYLVRRVSGMKDGMVELRCEESMAAMEKELLSKEKILGKVIYNG